MNRNKQKENIVISRKDSLNSNCQQSRQ